MFLALQTTGFSTRAHNLENFQQQKTLTAFTALFSLKDE